MDFMRVAIDEAKKAFAEGEVPVGAVITREGRLLAAAHNMRLSRKTATAHAEIIAIDRACAILEDWRLDGCDIYITVEPCFMCAGAILSARIKRVYFGALEPKFGALVSNADIFSIPTLNHHPEVERGFYELEIAQLMREFFQARRH
ncbi:MAG: nucleoside deaminase [Deferribacteraceae bacterium]|jgi:tRNA(adenine34) deaminase|nr:nucleoside deaminase [Deferribacteraceae bacterium]